MGCLSLGCSKAARSPGFVTAAVVIGHGRVVPVAVGGHHAEEHHESDQDDDAEEEAVEAMLILPASAV